MLKLVFIGAGGFFGSIFRYTISGFVYKVMGESWFPYGTLVVNIMGCFLIGLLSGLSENRQLFNPETRLFVFVGFLGGFTTFSTFGYEVFSFAHAGQFVSSLSNISLHLFLGLGAVWAGYSFSKLF